MCLAVEEAVLFCMGVGGLGVGFLGKSSKHGAQTSNSTRRPGIGSPGEGMGDYTGWYRLAW